MNEPIRITRIPGYNHRDLFETLFLPILFAGIGAFMMVIGFTAIQDRKDAERAEAACQARGMEMTNLVQGAGKHSTHKRLCRGPDGTLYAL